MTSVLSPDEFSRLDKLFTDRDAMSPSESFSRRARRGIDVLVGSDITSSYGLQLALLTAINLGAKCFANARAHAPRDVWSAPCLVPVARAATLGDAVLELGGTPEVSRVTRSDQPYLLLGDAFPEGTAIRLTYDGWLLSVGPAREVPRLTERAFCPLASIGGAALALSEIFLEFAGIDIGASRRVLGLSLWRPDSIGRPDATGEPIPELPEAIATFGLGHLGQAYLWAIAALPYSARERVSLLLCDDDRVAKANIETGALLRPGPLGELKSRMAAKWLEDRGFSTKLLERRIDANFRRTEQEPVVALSGFDNNDARQCLASACFERIFDSGLGGEAHNFDTIAYHSWPNPRQASDLWITESPEQASSRKMRTEELAERNAAYHDLSADDCGRLLFAGESIAVPFVGAFASCVVLAELIKHVNGGPTFHDLRVQLGTMTLQNTVAQLAFESACPIRGLPVQLAKR